MSKPCACCEKCSPYLLSLLRIVIAALILQHGGQKVFGYPTFPHGQVAIPLTSMPGIAGILELVGGLFLLLGIFTRPTAFILSGEMAVAYFGWHARHALWPIHNGGDLPIIFCFVFLYLSAAGPGPLSLDHIFWKPGAEQPDEEAPETDDDDAQMTS